MVNPHMTIGNAKKIDKMFVLLFLMLFFSFWQHPSTSNNRSTAINPCVESQPYINHSPISISKNIEFNSDNGVVSGSGTLNDPYIIENWFINVSEWSDPSAGILIRDSNVYVIIQNCVINYTIDHNHSMVCNQLTCGIDLMNTTNIIVSNNIVLNTSFGIELDSSQNCTIEDNHLSNNGQGISVDDSIDNLIKDNLMSNDGDGLNFDGSSNNNILNNDANNGGTGINFYRSKDNRIYDNIASNNVIGINFAESWNNLIYENSFYNNSKFNAYADGTSLNKWHNFIMGNYYGNYKSKYPHASHIADIWLTPYKIDGRTSDTDPFPLYESYTSITQFLITLFLLLGLFLAFIAVVLIVSLIIYRKLKKRKISRSAIDSNPS